MTPEYKDLLIRLLTIQADCEIGGPHIYVDHWTLRAPTVDDQWRVARIASEEIDHCRKMLRLLNLIEVDRSDILERPRSKREVDAFKEDMPTWADFAAFGFLIDKVGEYQLDEMVGSTFAPIDDTLPIILREEKGHVAYGEQQLQKLIDSGTDGKTQAQAAISKWVRHRTRHVRQVGLGAHRALSRVGLEEAHERGGAPAVHRGDGAQDHRARPRRTGPAAGQEVPLADDSA